MSDETVPGRILPYRSCSLSHCTEPAEANGRCAEHQNVVAMGRPDTAQIITLTVDVTDPAHPAHHGSFPLGLRPAQLAAGRAALRAAAQTLDHRLKEALHEPAGRLTREDVEQFARETLARARAGAVSRHAPRAGDAHRPPDLCQVHQGRLGEVVIEAWDVPPPSQSAGLVAWFVRHPAAHPVWCWWLVSVVHLRPGEGLPPAAVRRAGQTHDLAIIPLKPESDISPDHPGRVVFMSPDVMLPLCALTDAQAVRACRAAVDLIVAGQSPDSDFRALWLAWAEQAAEQARAKQEVQGG